jgi:hypothetical protein
VAISETDRAQHGTDDAEALLQKWLVLGDSERRWRLPDETNLGHLEARIKAAIRSAEPLAIEVVGDGHALHTVVLNGRAAPFVEIYAFSDATGPA